MRRIVSVSAAALLVLVMAACGDDSDDSSAATAGGDAATTAAPATTAAAPETTAAPEAEATVVDVEMADFSYTAPTEVPAGLVTVDATNSGAEEHQATILRLNDGVTLQQALGTFAQDELEGFKLITLHGGPNGVAPGASQSTTQELAEGNYAYVCFIPSPSDGVPHAAKGMLMEFTVTAPEGEAAATPEADAQVVLDDFSFTFPADFDGQGTFEVVNEADQPHEMTLYQLAEGATLADVQGFFTSEAPPTGPPPISPAGGSAAQAPATSTFVPLELAPGNYVMVCFIPDAASGQPHVALGMISEFAVT